MNGAFSPSAKVRWKQFTQLHMVTWCLTVVIDVTVYEINTVHNKTWPSTIDLNLFVNRDPCMTRPGRLQIPSPNKYLWSGIFPDARFGTGIMEPCQWLLGTTRNSCEANLCFLGSISTFGLMVWAKTEKPWFWQWFQVASADTEEHPEEEARVSVLILGLGTLSFTIPSLSCFFTHATKDVNSEKYLPWEVLSMVQIPMTQFTLLKVW